MNFKDLPAGKDVPNEVNALIEISKGAGKVKYEYDRENGTIVVDRLRDSSMFYPINYGAIPQTISDDGDPLDILVFCDDAIQTGTVIPARPVGVLLMDDEKGHDVKIIAVPADRLTTAYRHIRDINDLPENERKKIEHFFKHYKDLEGAGQKFSVTSGWEGVERAREYIEKGVATARKPAAKSDKPPAP